MLGEVFFTSSVEIYVVYYIDIFIGENMIELYKDLEKVDDYRWIIPKSGNMRVPGLIFSSEKMLNQIFSDEAPVQVKNAATLPGIVKYSMAMPDIHWGYGLPIGGVIATNLDDGIISPGGVGSDINCGVRMIRTNLSQSDVKNHIKSLISVLFQEIPCGVGSHGRIKLSREDEKKVLIEGSQWAVKNGYGWAEDVDFTEDRGRLDGADPSVVSNRAMERGRDQLGTLGAGNHFLEIQVVDKIFNVDIAQKFGIFKDQICVMVHCGSRGLGHQVCDDYLEKMGRAVSKYKIELPDRQLACAPLNSPEGKEYFSAMKSAANYAYANRQCIMHWVRCSFEKVLEQSAEKLGMHLIYDVTHNTAKIEEHNVDGKKMKVCVHRKGATRSFPAKMPGLPKKYYDIGQPVIIPGDMGRSSFLLVGKDKAMEYSFGSTCHGAGRLMSRNKAIKITKGRAIERELEDKGIFVKSRGRETLREEFPEAYKDVRDVVEVVHNAGLSEKIAQLIPIGVVKG
jgi:tRNA-splicing ligase RtcB